ncbi:hypothetical protein FB451DRAFT_1394134 [Mycena latifolia]|nr:hypothetical protein FB451DRAFT_1394134 [Mycena latifolia]
MPSKSNPESLSPDISSSRPTIFSLPNELLVAITAAGQEGRVPNDDFKSEWMLSHVSRRFRDVILCVPILWTFVEVDPTLEGSAEIMRLYLARSRGHRIRANLCERSSLIVEPDLIAKRLGHILPHTQRISRLSIRATELSIAPMFIVLQAAVVPVLHDLEIEVVKNKYDWRFLSSLFSLTPPPALTVLKIVGFAPKLPLPQWMVSLTHLEISRTKHLLAWVNGTWDSIDFTTQCTALIQLYIDTSLWDIYSQRRIIVPSLKSLHLAVGPDAGALHLLGIIRLFDTLALTDLVMDYIHGDQILENTPIPPISSLPPRLFPALSSLTLINQCFTAHVVEQILGPASQPWPLLETVTICPTLETMQDVYSTLQGVISSKHRSTQTIPKFRFSSMLFKQSYWDENGVDVELFDPAEMVKGVAALW